MPFAIDMLFCTKALYFALSPKCACLEGWEEEGPATTWKAHVPNEGAQILPPASPVTPQTRYLPNKSDM